MNRLDVLRVAALRVKVFHPATDHDTSMEEVVLAHVLSNDTSAAIHNSRDLSKLITEGLRGVINGNTVSLLLTITVASAELPSQLRRDKENTHVPKEISLRLKDTCSDVDNAASFSIT
jgi:hypothetical protein